MKKPVAYLREMAGQDIRAIEKEKERLVRRGDLVVTFIEGEREMEEGLFELLKNHYIHNIA